MRTNNWPKSLPDYGWPEQFAAWHMAPLRWTMAALFHVSHALGRGFARIAKRWQRYEAQPTLLIRTDGIGDALLFEPALESLARRVSPSEVHLWAPRETCQLFEECPTLTRRLSIPRGGKAGNLNYFRSAWWRMKIGFELARWDFQCVVYPAQSPEPLGNWLFVSARADEKLINFGDLDNQFVWQQTRTHRAATFVLETRPGNAHELARNEYLAGQWSRENRLRRPRVHLSARASFNADRLVNAWRRAAERMGAGDVVGLVVGSASKAKHYPVAQWVETLTKLWEAHRAVAVLLGGPQDRVAMDDLARKLGRVPHLRLARPVNLLTIAAIIRRLDGVLAVDTGLAHIALTQRVPSVVLLTGGHPGRFFPWPSTAQHVVLNVSMPCDGCKNQCHLEEPFCITRIAPDDIVHAYAKLRVKDKAIEPFLVPAASQEMQLAKAAG